MSEHFEFRHFRPDYLNVDTIFAEFRVLLLELGIEVHTRCLLQCSSI
jgi:hypothetical protein